MRTVLLLLLLMAPSIGCTVQALTTYAKTSEIVVAEKGKGCEFDIQSTLPSSSDYKEIGVINGCSGTVKILEYKLGIRDVVCKAGGDLVTAQVNTFGAYCLGIIFVKNPKP